MQNRVTLKDIADEAGVSVMTVSNSLNGKRERVSERTLMRIEQIAAARGYVANASARALAANASRLIGLLVLAADEAPLSLSPYNVDMFSAVEHELRGHGYHVLFRGVSSVQEVDTALRTWNLDGAIVLGFPDALIEQLAAPAGTPIVALDSYAASTPVTEVRSDDRRGGYLAAQHLLEHGHQRILFAAPAFGNSGVIHERFQGFTDAHREHGVTWKQTDRAEAEATYEAGVAIGMKLRKSHPATTAVFATADVMAIGIIAGARTSGLRVPDDLSIIGYDNLDIDTYLDPTLTSIDQNVSGKGARAARLLLDRIHDTSIENAVIADDNVSLIPRGSVIPR